MFFLIFDDLSITLLLFNDGIAFELYLHFGLFDYKLHYLRGELTDESFIEFEFLWIRDLIEFNNEVRVKVKE